MADPMTKDRLAQWGEAIFGERWKAPLAREADVRLRTMFRWAAGETPIRLTEQELQAVFRRVQARRAEEAKTMKKPAHP